jgi:superoxide dismutase
MPTVTQEVPAIVIYALTTAISVIGVLLLLMYNKHQTELLKNQADAIRVTDELAKKASSDALKEARDHFNGTIAKHHSDYQERLRELAMKQDREIDWLKEEMDKISANLNEMRKEAMAANNAIMARLDMVLSNERRHQSS